MYLQQHAFITVCLPTYINIYGFLLPYICACIHTYMICAQILTCIEYEGLPTYIDMYLATHSYMSGCINIEVNT